MLQERKDKAENQLVSITYQYCTYKAGRDTYKLVRGLWPSYSMCHPGPMVFVQRSKS